MDSRDLRMLSRVVIAEVATQIHDYVSHIQINEIFST
jgi:hypothetical protein